MGAKGKGRTKLQRDNDRARISELYLKGWYQSQIAEELGISQSQVSRDLKAVQKEWLQSSLVDFNEARARELAKLDEIEREAWLAWERDKQELRSEALKEVRSSKNSKKTEKTVTRKQRSPDPRYLQIIESCVNRRSRILGLNAPQEFAGEINVSDTPRERITRKLASLAARKDQK